MTATETRIIPFTDPSILKQSRRDCLQRLCLALQRLDTESLLQIESTLRIACSGAKGRTICRIAAKLRRRYDVPFCDELLHQLSSDAERQRRPVAAPGA